jgi:hypothetical protein
MPDDARPAAAFNGILLLMCAAALLRPPPLDGRFPRRQRSVLPSSGQDPGSKMPSGQRGNSSGGALRRPVKTTRRIS